MIKFSYWGKNAWRRHTNWTCGMNKDENVYILLWSGLKYIIIHNLLFTCWQICLSWAGRWRSRKSGPPLHSLWLSVCTPFHQTRQLTHPASRRAAWSELPWSLCMDCSSVAAQSHKSFCFQSLAHSHPQHRCQTMLMTFVVQLAFPSPFSARLWVIWNNNCCSNMECKMSATWWMLMYSIIYNYYINRIINRIHWIIKNTMKINVLASWPRSTVMTHIYRYWSPDSYSFCWKAEPSLADAAAPPSEERQSYRAFRWV